MSFTREFSWKPAEAGVVTGRWGAVSLRASGTPRPGRGSCCSDRSRTPVRSPAGSGGQGRGQPPGNCGGWQEGQGGWAQAGVCWWRSCFSRELNPTGPLPLKRCRIFPGLLGTDPVSLPLVCRETLAREKNSQKTVKAKENSHARQNKNPLSVKHNQGPLVPLQRLQTTF